MSSTDTLAIACPLGYELQRVPASPLEQRRPLALVQRLERRIEQVAADCTAASCAAASGRSHFVQSHQHSATIAGISVRFVPNHGSRDHRASRAASGQRRVQPQHQLAFPREALVPVAERSRQRRRVAMPTTNASAKPPSTARQGRHHGGRLGSGDARSGYGAVVMRTTQGR